MPCLQKKNSTFIQAKLLNQSRNIMDKDSSMSHSVTGVVIEVCIVKFIIIVVIIVGKTSIFLAITFLSCIKLFFRSWHCVIFYVDTDISDKHPSSIFSIGGVKGKVYIWLRI
jgi:hypothetical protein